MEKASPKEKETSTTPRGAQPTHQEVTTKPPHDDLSDLGLDTINIDIDGGNVGDVAPAPQPGGEVIESFEMEMLRAEMNEMRAELKAANAEKAKLHGLLERVNSDMKSKGKHKNKYFILFISYLSFEKKTLEVNWEQAKEEEWANQNEEKRVKLEQELNELR